MFSWRWYCFISKTVISVHEDPPFLGRLATATADTFIVVDVTPIVQGWMTTPSSNHGFAICASTTAPNTFALFDSNESQETGHAASRRSTYPLLGPKAVCVLLVGSGCADQKVTCFSPAGSYTITVTGTSKFGTTTLTQTTTIAFTVGADGAISASSTSNGQ